ncbi:MAG: 1-acyl-sn-glycerol-3-phosphate acyltransferase [Polyangiales bacterium]
MATERKTYEPNAVLRWLYKRFFAHISVDERWSQAMEDAAKRGIPVYVMRSISFLDFLCLDFLTKQFALPLIQFVNDLGLWILEPFGKGRRRLRFRRQIPEDKALRATVTDGASALLFLRRPPRIGRVKRGGKELEVDLIRTLIQAQRSLEQPILLVPQTFVWTKLPAQGQRSLWDFMFGPREWPGRVRVFIQFVLNYRNALLRTGDPFDLQGFLARNPNVPDDRLADRVRYALLTRIERERTLVVGPEKKTRSRLADEILRSPRIRPQTEAEAHRMGKTVAQVEAQARKELARLGADQDHVVLRWVHAILHRVWHRIYDGIEIDQEGIERVRDAARKGPLVLLPSHKSHVDYLVLSDVLYGHDISPPLIAAGDNLAFWPLGAVLRRCGAFFIRRSFRGKKLYAALVSAYIRKLLAEQFNIEFFLEGGRSRTGKLLPPKFGLLSMVVDGVLQLPSRYVQFVPISIGYERIIEGRSYVDELTGGEKQQESIGGLLRTPQVLRSKYGRLYVQFGEVLPFDRALEETVGTNADTDDLTSAQRRALVQRIAHQVVHQINRVTVVTPASIVATALLTQTGAGHRRDLLLRRIELLAECLAGQGARFARSLRAESGQIRSETVEEALRLFMDGRLVTRADADDDEAVFVVPDERRIALEYYKNNTLHFFVSPALIAVAVSEGGIGGRSIEQAKARVGAFSRLLKYEFMFRADATFDAIFDDALGGMLARKELVRDGDTLRRHDGPGGERLDLYVDLVRTYFESYRLAMRGAELLVEGAMSKKEWTKRTLAIGQRMYLAGEIERRESVAKPRLENALRALHDMHLVHFDAETVEQGAELGDPKAFRARAPEFLAFT